MPASRGSPSAPPTLGNDSSAAASIELGCGHPVPRRLVSAVRQLGRQVALGAGALQELPGFRVLSTLSTFDQRNFLTQHLAQEQRNLGGRSSWSWNSLKAGGERVAGDERLRRCQRESTRPLTCVPPSTATVRFRRSSDLENPSTLARWGQPLRGTGPNRCGK